MYVCIYIKKRNGYSILSRCHCNSCNVNTSIDIGYVCSVFFFIQDGMLWVINSQSGAFRKIYFLMEFSNIGKDTSSIDYDYILYIDYILVTSSLKFCA